MRSILEDWPLLGVRSIQALAMSIMLGVVYWQLQPNQSSLRDHFGVLYMISVMYPYLIVVDIIETCRLIERLGGWLLDFVWYFWLREREGERESFMSACACSVKCFKKP